MSTLEYRFMKSAPVLRALAQSRLNPPFPPLPHLLLGSSEYADKVGPFDFIDDSLTFGHLQSAEDSHIRREFEQQREYIAGKFEQMHYDNGRRDTILDQRFANLWQKLERFQDEVGHRFDEVDQRSGRRFDDVDQRFNKVDQRFNEVDQRFNEVDQRFNELHARMFNSLSYRAHHQIHPVALLVDRRLQKPDPERFPRTIKKFWNLRSPVNAYNRFYLLDFYSIEEYKWWNRESDGSESDSSDSAKESLTLENAARSYPSRCLEVLAARLGLHYDKICAERKRLEEYRQQVAAQPSKRRKMDATSSEDSEIAKLVHKSQALSTTSEMRPKRLVQVRNSEGSTEVVSETDLPGATQQSQRSTSGRGQGPAGDGMELDDWSRLIQSKEARSN